MLYGPISMKLLIIGDIHHKINNFENGIVFLKWIIEQVNIVKPDLIVNLGDTFHYHSIVRSEIMDEFIKHVEACALVAPYVYVVGNHDMFRPNDNRYHALSSFHGKINNFHIIDSPTDMFDITFVPYCHDPSKFPTVTLPLCIAHQTFKGADYGSMIAKDGVDPNDISADLIISGHIHKRQHVGKVIYPGSTIAQEASDIDQEKGIMIFDTATYKYSYIPSPLPRWRSLKYDINAAFDIEALFLSLEQKLNDDDHWFVDIIGPKSELSSYLSSKRHLKLIDNKKVSIRVKFNDKDKKVTKIKALSIQSIISEYFDKVYTGTIDKDKLKVKAAEIISKSTI